MGRTIPFEAALLASLCTLSTQLSYREICAQFNISKGRFVMIFHKIINLICKYMNHFIAWPEGHLVDETLDEFKAKGFPGTVGVLDASYIQVDRPTEKDVANPDSYYNRDGFFSITLIATCNASLKFTYVYAGGPGSFHDARVLQLCDLGNALEKNPQNLFMSDNHHILGDSAFPLLINLLTPFKDDGLLTDAQTTYNTKLASARSVIGRTFNLLKSKFKRLRNLKLHSIAGCVQAIHAATILHNVFLEDSDLDENYEGDSDAMCYEDDIDDMLEPLVAVYGERAEEKRNEIADSFIQ